LALDVEHDDPAAGDAGHFRDQARQPVGMEVVRELDRRDQVDRAIGERQAEGIPLDDVERWPLSAGQRDRRGVAVEPEHAVRNALSLQSSAQRLREVARARADVEDRDGLVAVRILVEETLKLAAAGSASSRAAGDAPEDLVGLGNLSLGQAGGRPSIRVQPNEPGSTTKA